MTASFYEGAPKEPGMRVDRGGYAGQPAQFNQASYDVVFDTMERLRVAAKLSPEDKLSPVLVELVMANLNAFSRGTATVGEMNAVFKLAAVIDDVAEQMMAR